MPHRSRLGGISIDCRTGDLEGAAAFWATVLGSAVEPAAANYMRLGRENGLHVEVQQVDHESRVHLDIETDDIAAEVARLEKLGAKTVAEIQTWVVMEAPTGHRFCIVPEQTTGFADGARAWED